MIKIVRTNSSNSDFLILVRKLDAELAIRDGDDHAFYSQFNTLEKIRHVILAYADGEPAGCGAIKKYSAGTMEIKRMFVLPDHRRKGIAAKILAELEPWAAELSFRKCILETGKKQPEAIELYKKNGYQPIANYGQYVGVENSVCFEKKILLY
jgi:putative acetyltransferase